VPLQRQVALKLVRPDQRFFPGARERFRREVLAVARLSHPGIVPILTCGEAEGIPFYAMELVAGASLAEILHELAGTAPAALDGPALRQALQRAMAKKGHDAAVADAPLFEGSWTNVCCRMVRDAAEALQHAHEQGVLHRDVKPSNLLLTATGRVRLIDFGLASAHGEQRITRSGTAFGSLPYMAPEQVRGEVAAIDRRTDVYALGVTLYELLTLTLPHGDGSGTTRDRILAGLVEPPAVRNARIHPDVDAVCLLAMDLEAQRRYPTAAAFADDLRAFLEQRSVRARRPSWLLRARRWSRRHPARAAALVVLFLVLGPGPLVFGVQQSLAATRIQDALDDAGEQRRQADVLRGHAERNLDEALAAVDQLLFRTATARLADHPRTAKLQRSLMEDAVGFYERLLASTPTDTQHLRVRLQRAHTQVRLGRLQMGLGALDKAAALLEEAIATFAAGGPLVAQRASLLEEEAHAHHTLSEVYGRMDRVVDQEIAERRALAMYQQVLQADPTDASVVQALRDSRLSLVSALGRAHKFAEAAAQLDVVEQDVLLPPPERLDAERAAMWRLDAVHAADFRGVLLTEQGETELALQSFATALDRVAALPADLQRRDDVRSARLGVLERLGQICLQRRDWERAARWLEEAAVELEARAAEEPDLIAWRTRLASILGSRATNRRELHDAEGAKADHDRAIALLEQVVRDAPTVAHPRRMLAIAFAERAGSRFAVGDSAAALEDLQDAEARYAEVVAGSPDDLVAKANYVAVMANQARALAGLQRVDEARNKTEAAIEIARTGSGGENERAMVELCSLAGDLAMRDDDHEAGQRWMAEAGERAAVWLQKRPEDPLRLGTAAMIAANHGTMYLQLREHERAKALWEGALPTARVRARAAAGTSCVLAVCLLRLADVAMRDADLAKAREWFAAALAETGVTQAKVKGYASLAALFDNPDLRDLLTAPRPGADK